MECKTSTPEDISKFAAHWMRRAIPDIRLGGGGQHASQRAQAGRPAGDEDADKVLEAISGLGDLLFVSDFEGAVKYGRALLNPSGGTTGILYISRDTIRPFKFYSPKLATAAQADGRALLPDLLSHAEQLKTE
jgi:hypothetical protein